METKVVNNELYFNFPDQGFLEYSVNCGSSVLVESFKYNTYTIPINDIYNTATINLTKLTIDGENFINATMITALTKAAIESNIELFFTNLDYTCDASFVIDGSNITLTINTDFDGKIFIETTLTAGIGTIVGLTDYDPESYNFKIPLSTEGVYCVKLNAATATNSSMINRYNYLHIPSLKCKVSENVAVSKNYDLMFAYEALVLSSECVGCDCLSSCELYKIVNNLLSNECC